MVVILWMSLCRYAGLGYLGLMLICCGAIAAEAQEKEQAGEEPSFEMPLLQKAEIVEVVGATWAEIDDRCRTEQSVETLQSPGRLITLRVGEDIYRMFLSGGRVIHCLETDVSDEQPSLQMDRGLQEIADVARRDLGQRLDADPGDIQVLRAERVTWRDSSAGCAESGRVYMPVLTEGARVVLGFSGAEHHYHQVAGGKPFLCENPSPIEPLPGPEIE